MSDTLPPRQSAVVPSEEGYKCISRHEVKEVLDVIKQLPDFKRLALPASIHEEFNIPMDGYITGTLMDFYTRYAEIRCAGGEKGETRGPKLDADGKPVIRPMLSFPEVKLEIERETLPELEDTSSPSKADDTQESQPCPDDSSSHAHDAE